MERKVGSKFEFCGKLLRVEENKRADCSECFMFEHDLPCQNSILMDMTGYCFDDTRSDNKDVIFVEIK